LLIVTYRPEFEPHKPPCLISRHLQAGV